MNNREILLSERFVSLQGEGITTGEPAAFVRLGRCNLRCTWCDTPYSWDFDRYSFEEETSSVSFAELISWLLANAPGRVIWTGGEPLIQQKLLAELLPELDAAFEEANHRSLYYEVETNGTVPPDEHLLARIDQWNVSPKLENSGEAKERRIRPGALTKLKETGRAYFKFVVDEKADLQEVEDLIRDLDLPRDRVLFMPKARSPEELKERSGWVAAAALQRRVRYSHRLHLELYGGKRGT